MTKIVCCIGFTAEQKRLLESMKNTELVYCSSEEVNKEQLWNAEVIMGNISVSMLKYAKDLRWMQLSSAGANPYCMSGVLPEEVKLTNAAGAYGASVSEHMLAVTLAMIKKLYLYGDNQKEHVWNDEGPVISTEDAIVLILGMGDIGCAYARKMKALGSYVIGVRKKKESCPEGYDEVVGMDELDKVLPRADITAIILPGTDETSGMFNGEVLHKMKKGSYLLNAGRGSIIELEALEEVMKEGYLSGVSLDVTDPEPLPVNHPLWSTPHVWITPHVAGGFHIPETLDNVFRICRENLEAYMQGRELNHLVDRNKQY